MKRRCFLMAVLCCAAAALSGCSSSDKKVENVDIAPYVAGRYAVSADVSDNVNDVKDIQDVYATLTRVDHNVLRFTATVEIDGKDFPVEARLDVRGTRDNVTLEGKTISGSVEYDFSGKIRTQNYITLSVYVYLEGKSDEYANSLHDYLIIFEGTKGATIGQTDPLAGPVVGYYDTELSIETSTGNYESESTIRILERTPSSVDFTISNFSLSEGMIPLTVIVTGVYLEGDYGDITFEYDGSIDIPIVTTSTPVNFTGTIRDSKLLDFTLEIPSMSVTVYGDGQRQLSEDR